MPLLNAAIAPHSPILVPEIGKVNRQFLDKTVAAYETLAQELAGNDIETIVIISPHGNCQADRFTINAGPETAIDLSSFGFLGAKRKFISDLSLIDQIKNITGDQLQLISNPRLDYASSVSLHLLAAGLPDVKIVSLYCAAELELSAHLDLGKQLAQAIGQSAKRIAVIASADLSHRLKKNSPNGYSPKGAKFDNRLLEFLADPSTAAENILNLDRHLIADAGECGLKSIVILLGALTGHASNSAQLAYQTELGIGYLTLDFQLD